jgi:hypothetical protein
MTPTTKAVIIAVISTVGVCGLCLGVYDELVLDREGTAPSQGRETASVEAARPGQLPARRLQSSEGAQTSLAAALLRELIKANARTSTEEEPEANEGSDPADASTEEDEALEASEEALFADQKAEMQRLDNLLDGEVADLDWAARAEEAMAESARLLDTMWLDEVACRQTFCRARTTHVDPKTRAKDLIKLTAGQGSTQMVAYVPPDRKSTTVVYFARKDHDLPEVRSSPPVAEMDRDHVQAHVRDQE